MKKYEACGALVQMKEHFRRSIESYGKYQAKAPETDEEKKREASMRDYYAEESDKLARWIEALDMAGDSMVNGKH